MTKALTRIASSSPGRIRIRDLALRNRSRMEAVEQALQAIKGIHGVTTNAAAGSVVLHYDPTSIAPIELEHRIDAIVDAALAAPGKPGRHTLRRHANRAAKLGMLGSLSASLALAAAGNKRWHAVTGGVFLACLGVHVGLHRKAVFR
ncbi:HMA2 domain-containing protein [Thauera aminoaromatica]|uniref:Cation transporter n=1 Tax=Thauera aminoaromatica TaxID=164330 RepID=A0A5C7T941_THASP|nr:hypothetical protein [Thauera aminoaromatica]TXH92202.1 MAG: cation transporter [Thauera aminoaromatica]